MILSLRSSIRRLFSFIKTMIMIDTAMIAKNVIKTLNDGAEIENSHGIAETSAVIPTKEIPIAKPLTSETGMHRVTRFKNPVYVSTKTQSDLYSSAVNTSGA